MFRIQRPSRTDYLTDIIFLLTLFLDIGFVKKSLFNILSIFKLFAVLSIKPRHRQVQLSKLDHVGLFYKLADSLTPRLVKTLLS